MVLTEDNGPHTKARCSSMQLIIDESLNDGFIKLHHILRTSIPLLGDYGAKINSCLESSSLKRVSSMIITILLTTRIRKTKYENR